MRWIDIVLRVNLFASLIRDATMDKAICQICIRELSTLIHFLFDSILYTYHTLIKWMAFFGSV